MALVAWGLLEEKFVYGKLAERSGKGIVRSKGKKRMVRLTERGIAILNEHDKTEAAKKNRRRVEAQERMQKILGTITEPVWFEGYYFEPVINRIRRKKPK